MPFAISPKHNLEDFPGGLALDDKVEVFIERVEGWLLGPAIEMIKVAIGYRGFALLAMVTSYFEMIAKYSEGFVGERQTATYFKKGLQLVFPDMTLPNDEKLLNAIYDRVRNGIYHLGMTKPKVLLVDAQTVPGSIGYQAATDLIAIAPDTLVDDLRIHFSFFAGQLRNRENAELRAKFEARFDMDNA